MHKMYLYVLCAAMALLWFPDGSASAQTKQELLQQHPGLAADLDNSLEGRSFVFAFPPNEATGVNIIQRALEVYVTSRFDTEVRLSVPGLGFGPVAKQVKANEITTFSGEANELSWAMEVRESDGVTDKGVFITSDAPIKVWVLSAKRFSSEGSGIRPVTALGNDYQHLGYYDYPEAQTVRGGGFVVVAQEDETQVVFNLDGTSSGGTTVGGRSIGQSFIVTLSRGQTYMVKGSGIDRTFDLTGSRISSTKPIAVMSFHERTIIPTAMGSSSRDNLLEMLPPIMHCGTEHISLEFFRENTGDYFRIMALENDTEYEVRYYDKGDERELIGVRNGVLSNAGDWSEFEEVNPQGGAESIRGTAIWKSNKPTMLMQYSYSSGWDGNQEFDPFMLLVPPVEQYKTGVNVVGTPANAEFNTNWLNILVEIPEDPEPELPFLRQVMLDGVPVADRDPLFLVNQVPGTRIHWARINVAPGTHNVSSPLPMASFIYGFSRFESYGWTDGMASNVLNSADNVAPRFAAEGIGSQVIDIQVFDDADEDVGLAAIGLIEGESLNAMLEYADELHTGVILKESSVQFRKVDPGLSAKAVIFARDRAGNISVQEYEIEVPEIIIEPEILDFGLLRVGESAVQTVTLTNNSDRGVGLVTQEITPNGNFEFLEPSLPLVLEAGKKAAFTVRYTATEETAGGSGQDDEAMGILSTEDGIRAEFRLRGNGGISRLDVNTAKFNLTQAGTADCQNPAIILHNDGTFELTVTGMDALEAPFNWQGNPPELPLTLAPGERVELGPVCFVPPAIGDYSQSVRFTSDAAEPPAPRALLLGTSDKISPVKEFGIPEFGDFISLSPNPAKSELRLTWSAATRSELELSIIDVRGVKVYSRMLGLRDAGPDEVELDVRALSTGRYYVLLQGEGVNISHSLHIIR